MTIMYLNVDVRDPDYWLTEAATPGTRSVEVDLSDEFIERYDEAGRIYDGLQAELDLIYSSKEF